MKEEIEKLIKSWETLAEHYYESENYYKEAAKCGHSYIKGKYCAQADIFKICANQLKEVVKAKEE